jgi:hypothetical protein
MEPKKGMFGNGQKTCRVCGADLSKKREVRLDIKHADGTILSKLTYFAPLCENHNGEGSLAINIEWGDVVPIDQTME